MKKSSSDDSREDLYSFWNKLPIFKAVGNQEDWKLIDQHGRKKILSILTEGVREEFPKGSENIRVRRALTAFEILKLMNKNSETKFKITNLYFHLQKLEEQGFIQVVKTFKTGHRHSRYFGRTAKIIIPSNTTYEIKHNIFYDKIIGIIKLLHPEQKDSELNELVKKIENPSPNDHEETKDWIEKNNDLLQKLDIDYKELYLFLMKLKSMNPERTRHYQSFAKLLDFNTQDE